MPINTVFITGKVFSFNTSKVLPGGKKFFSFKLIIKNRENSSVIVNVDTLDKIAIICEQKIKKNTKICLLGELIYRNFYDKNTGNYKDLSITAKHIYIYD